MQLILAGNDPYCWSERFLLLAATGKRWSHLTNDQLRQILGIKIPSSAQAKKGATKSKSTRFGHKQLATRVASLTPHVETKLGGREALLKTIKSAVTKARTAARKQGREPTQNELRAAALKAIRQVAGIVKTGKPITAKTVPTAKPTAVSAKTPAAKTASPKPVEPIQTDDKGARRPRPNVLVNTKELTVQRADLVRRFGQNIVGSAEKNVQRILDDKGTNIYIRVGNSATLETILGDRFRTSAELGQDTHTIPHLLDKSYQKARNRVEALTMGYDLKTKPEDRPIYGYFGSDNLNGASHTSVSQAYGSIAIKLKSEVKNRCTFTGADSFKSGFASQVSNDSTPPPPNAASLVSLTRHGYERAELPSHYSSFYKDKSGDRAQLQASTTAKNIDQLAPALAPTGNRYVEAQIHGHVKPEDIAEIHFSPSNPSDRPTVAIAKWAKDNGVKIYTNGKSEDLDALINPKKKSKAQQMAEALQNGDFDTLHQMCDFVQQRAQNVKGHKDAILRVLYEDAGFDGLPQVVSSQDVTDAWKNGGILMVRGLSRGLKNRTEYFEQFKSGDYFAGAGIYGNGTYVSAAYKPNEADAKGAFNVIDKMGYTSASDVTMRMALSQDANIIKQSEFEKEHKRLSNLVNNWDAKETARIPAIPQQHISANDLIKLNKASQKIERYLQDNYEEKPTLGRARLDTSGGSFSYSLIRQLSLTPYDPDANKKLTLKT